MMKIAGTAAAAAILAIVAQQCLAADAPENSPGSSAAAGATIEAAVEHAERELAAANANRSVNP